MFQLAMKKVIRKFFGSARLDPIFFWLDLARADIFKGAFWVGSARAGFLSSAFWLGSARAGKKPARPTPIPNLSHAMRNVQIVRKCKVFF